MFREFFIVFFTVFAISLGCQDSYPDQGPASPDAGDQLDAGSDSLADTESATDAHADTDTSAEDPVDTDSDTEAPEGGIDAGPDGGENAVSWKFVSIPDYFNVDLGDLIALSSYEGGENSHNQSYQDAIDYVLDAVAAEQPDFVLVAGDLINGHWDEDVSEREIFGPVSTFDEKADAINRAADFYYTIWKRRFADRDLTTYAALGDHEIGDNDWIAGSDKSFLVPVWKEAFSRHFTLDRDSNPLFHERPVDTPWEQTAYAVQHKNALVVTLDVWRQDDPAVKLSGKGSVLADVTGGQLAWLEDVLGAAGADPSINHVLVQGHTPILVPVRKQNSSGLTLSGAEQSALWAIFAKYRIDLYIAGETHHMTASNHGVVEQIVHGSNIGSAPNTSYLVGTVYPERIELELKWIKLFHNEPGTGSIWQTGSNRPYLEVYVDMETGLSSAGTLTIDKSDGHPVYLDRTGYFELYETP